MKNRLVPGLFSTISDAELFTATMGAEVSDEEQSSSAGQAASSVTETSYESASKIRKKHK